MSISDAIQAEIERQGLTAYAVAKLAGITPNVVSRFLSGERDITHQSEVEPAVR
jgi:predicted transcriptional regulator